MAVSSVSDMSAKQQGANGAQGMGRIWLKRLGPFLPIIALAVIASLTVDGFGTTPNLIAVVQASAITGIAAIGTAAITISGKFVSLAIEQQAAHGAPAPQHHHGLRTRQRAAARQPLALRRDDMQPADRDARQQLSQEPAREPEAAWQRKGGILGRRMIGFG